MPKTLEELEAELAQLTDEKTAWLAEKTQLETRVSKTAKNNSELLNEKKKLQSLQKFLMDMGLESDDLESIGEKLSGLLDADDKSGDKSGTKNKGLLDALKAQTQTYKQQLEESQKVLQQERIERLALIELSKAPDVVSTTQMRLLLSNDLNLNDAGKLIVSANGVEVELGKHLDTLRKDPAWQNQFRASTKPGMNSENNGQPGAGGNKAWKDMNTTERAIAASAKPELAKADFEDAGLEIFMQ
jgi:hypothetical protein